MVGMCIIFFGTSWSYYRHLSIIKYLLYIQAGVMVISNYNSYKPDENVNSQGLNMLSTVFSVLFCILNCFLAGLLIDDSRVKGVSTFFVFVLLEFVIIDTSFVFGDLTSHTSIAISLTIIYTIIFIPVFGYIQNSIVNEQVQEAKNSYL